MLGKLYEEVLERRNPEYNASELDLKREFWARHTARSFGSPLVMSEDWTDSTRAHVNASRQGYLPVVHALRLVLASIATRQEHAQPRRRVQEARLAAQLPEGAARTGWYFRRRFFSSSSVIRPNALPVLLGLHRGRAPDPGRSAGYPALDGCVHPHLL